MIELDKLKKAIELTYNRQYDEAEQLYLQLVEEYPNESAILSAFGLFYVSLQNYNKAVYYLKKAYDLHKTVGVVASYGFALYEQGEFATSVKILEEALEFGDNIDVYNKLILSLFELKKYNQAIELTDKMNELYPDNPKSVANKVKALTQVGKLLEAEKVCVEFLKKNQDSPSLWFHLGLLKELIYSDEEKAIECYKIAGEFGNISSDYNIAVAYQKLYEYKMAEEYYNRFLDNFPNDNDAKTSLGMCKLAQKNFKEGYELFYQRKGGIEEKLTHNLWKPNTELNKEIVIICDQGYGDHIQFIRYLPFFKDKKIKIAARKSLQSLFKKNYPNIEFIDYENVDSKMQAVRITDLAYILGMNFDNIPFAGGYLKSEKADIKNDKLKVGLCWEAGSAGMRGFINRTINIKCFEPLLDLKNIQVYSFQYDDTLKGNEKYPQMINLAKDFKDFSDTAEALLAMDVFVTVDTSVAHLAGALGVKTYLLLPYATDWRWFGTKDFTMTTTPWYKSVKIFQQSDHISWEKPIEKVITCLESLKNSF